MEILDNYNDNAEVLPYFYHRSYSHFMKSEENKSIFFIKDDETNTMCCKLWKNKFLKVIQPVYPPLNNFGERLSADKEKAFLNDFISFVENKRIAHRIIQPENFAIFRVAPSKTISTPFGTYFIDLQKKTEEELFKDLHSKHRNVILNAEKKGIVLKYGKEVIEDFYSLYEQTMQRSAMYYQPKDYFKNFYKHLSKNSICGVAYFNDIPQGALFMPFTKFGSFYLYGASAEKIQINGAINYLHWNTIKLLKKQNVKRYDFVGARLSDVSGTKLHGIQQFKERFGATLEKGYLWKKDVNALKCNLFDNMLSAKLKLKGLKTPLDIIDQERKKII